MNRQRSEKPELVLQFNEYCSSWEHGSDEGVIQRHPELQLLLQMMKHELRGRRLRDKYRLSVLAVVRNMSNEALDLLLQFPEAELQPAAQLAARLDLA